MKNAQRLVSPIIAQAGEDSTLKRTGGAGTLYWRIRNTFLVHGAAYTLKWAKRRKLSQATIHHALLGQWKRTPAIF